MEFKIGWHSDIGMRKSTNQDSLAIVEMQTPDGTALMAMICDGMGGLEKGELASATIIHTFTKWFEQEFPKIYQNGELDSEIGYQWRRMIKSLNQTIAQYGQDRHIHLGSTITIIIFLPNGHYIIAHVGDTRIYRITDFDIQALTEDQTVVAEEVRKGKLTPQQADVDPRRNILLQCVGASKVVEPVIIKGEYKEAESYLLCSDGFRHVISPETFMEKLKPSNITQESDIKTTLLYLVDLNIKRGESDNISALLVNIV